MFARIDKEIPMTLIRWFSGLLFLALTAAAWGDAADTPRELVFLTWSEYMDPELIESFEKKHAAKVRMVYFEGDDHRDELLIISDAKGYDVILADAVHLPAYVRRSWLAPLTEQEVPNLRHVDPYWKTAYKGTQGYAVPAFWGTFGIAYREDLVPEPIKSWRQLFEPQDELRGKIVMIRQQRDLIGVALKALGYSFNSNDAAELAAAERLLMEQKPFVGSYGYISLSEESSLVTGEVTVATMYNGDALMIREHDERIQFVVPEEGSFLWVDYLAVLASSPNQDLAMAFVNFLNEPEHAAQWAEYVYGATANQSAKALLSEEFLADPLVYPDEETMGKLEFLEPLPPRAARRWNAIFNQVVQ
jgi:spermidine/putrescine transport system substrate-binding protein